MGLTILVIFRNSVCVSDIAKSLNMSPYMRTRTSTRSRIYRYTGYNADTKIHMTNNITNIKYSARYTKTILCNILQIPDTGTIQNVHGINIFLEEIEYSGRLGFRALYTISRAIFPHIELPFVVVLPQRKAPKRKTPDWKVRLEKIVQIESKLVKDENEDACIVCLVHQRKVVLYPCLHKHMCATCANRILTDAKCKKTCPVCRRKIKKALIPIE